MRFLRQSALLLPSAFLLGALLFLLTHGRDDPGFGTFPFFEEWLGASLATRAPEARFLEQALVFFLPAYLVTLVFLAAIALAERTLFGRKKSRAASAYGRALAAAFPIVYLIATGVVVGLGDRLAARQAPGALVAPLLVATAPFLAAAPALPAAAVAAAALALLGKAGAA